MTETPDRSVHIFIAGRVQGVWFRGWLAKVAGEHGVEGWVRNLHDGRVEAVLTGPLDSVDDVLSKCRKGPPVARVDAIEIEEIRKPDGMIGFNRRPNA